MRVLARFMKSASDAGQFPAPTLPEIAFLGRSNVGKSSVINSLLGSKIARTSSTPGRTRSINFFEIRWPGKPQPELVFTDLPGYGYAKISREISQQWPSFIDPYLKERPCLALCVALVDANLPPQSADRQLLDFLSGIGRPTLIVATKSDRLSGNQLRNSLRILAEEYPQARVIPFSARTGDGRDELWRQIQGGVESHSRRPILNSFPKGESADLP
ncbi:MAG: ribosome biogenesis GTP-binding protein YihA/YsxC [Terriglobales bacterium]